jgi:prepilin-type N-terminal cleavage/methylation domain-containing protein
MVAQLMIRRKRQGYTIIEILVAIAILAIALPGLVVMVTGARKVQTNSIRLEQAAAFGQLILDSLELVPVAARASGSHISSIGNVNYTATWVLPAALGGAFRVPVTVSWTQGAKSHSVSIVGVLR